MANATILMVTWNALAHTRACLTSLRESGVPDERLLVVDNGSTDGTVAWLRAEGVRAIANGANLGFARAVNRGLVEAPADRDVVLLNNDVRLVPGWLDRLASCVAAHPRAGAVAARLAHPDGRLQDAGTRIVWDPLCLRHYGAGEPDVGQLASTRPVPAVSFTAVWLRREALAKTGPLDDDYFCYFEDVDLCLRLRAAGYDVLVCGELTLVHDEHATSRENRADHGRVFREAEAVFRRKWPHPPEPARGELLVLPYPGPDAESAAAIEAVLLGLEDRGWRVSMRPRLAWGSPLDAPEGGDDWSAFLRAQRFRLPAASPVPLLLGDPRSVAVEGGDGVCALTVKPPPPGARAAWAGVASGAPPGFEVVPLPVDPAYFFPRNRSSADPLTIVATGDPAALGAAARAFGAAFGGSRDSRLVLVATGPAAAPATIDGVEVRRLPWPTAAGRAALHAAGDVWIEPPGSSGWTLFAREAERSGLAVVGGEADLAAVLRGAAPRGEQPPVETPADALDRLSTRLATHGRSAPGRFAAGVEPPAGPLADPVLAPPGTPLATLAAARAATLSVANLHLRAALAAPSAGQARGDGAQRAALPWWRRLIGD